MRILSVCVVGCCVLDVTHYFVMKITKHAVQLMKDRYIVEHIAVVCERRTSTLPRCRAHSPSPNAHSRCDAHLTRRAAPAQYAVADPRERHVIKLQVSLGCFTDFIVCPPCVRVCFLLLLCCNHITLFLSLAHALIVLLLLEIVGRRMRILTFS